MTRKGIYFVVLGFVLLLAGVGCSEESVESTSTSPAPTPRATGSEASVSDEAALEAMQVIEEQVSDLRGLETLQPVTKAFLTTEKLRERIEKEFLEDYSEQEARDDVLLYVAFELAEPDLDLYNLLIDLQTEQVAGFYDPDTEEMYVVKGAEAPGALERSVFSHEYVHALQDQHFDLKALGFTKEEEKTAQRDSEQELAIRSLVEGDATLLQQQYMLQYFELEELQEMMDQVGETSSDVLDSAPAVIRESLLFPYEAGFIFASALYDEGGWAAIDAAYANPPLSAEQILHPQRYPDDVPQILSLPPLTDTLGAGWRQVDEDIIGEFGLQIYLDVYVSQSDAEAAAQGWGGDRYAVHWREDESAFVLVLQLAWDTPAEAAEFEEIYRQFAEERFGSGPARQEGGRKWWFGDDALLLARNDQDKTLVIIAPDETTLKAVHELFPEF